MHHYNNVETLRQRGGRKTVRRVYIKNNKGYKSVSRYYRGKRTGTVKRPLDPFDITRILSKKFIPGLFSDCKKKTKRTYL
jgi:hypothetical protein